MQLQVSLSFLGLGIGGSGVGDVLGVSASVLFSTLGSGAGVLVTLDSVMGLSSVVWCSGGGISVMVCRMLLSKSSSCFNRSISCIPSVFLVPFSALVGSAIALTMLSAGVSVGCAMNFVLKKTVSEILSLRVPVVWMI